MPGTLIYIPIWLDLLYAQAQNYQPQPTNLHSNMVRFIIVHYLNTSGHESAIYIPIWLDLLSVYYKTKLKEYINLHSNMVRFIII